MPEHLRKEPLEFIDEPDAFDLPLAGDCIKLYLYRLMDRTIRRERPSDDLWNQSFDPSAFRACLIHDAAGARTLSWLLNTANYDSTESTFGIKFIQATAFCLVGEDRTDVWWDMLKIQHAPKPTKDTAVLNQKYHSIRWSDAWFTAILEAQTFWTTQQNRLNEPLTTLLRVLRLDREERTGRTQIPIHGAINWIGAGCHCMTRATSTLKPGTPLPSFACSFSATRFERHASNTLSCNQCIQSVDVLIHC